MAGLFKDAGYPAKRDFATLNLMLDTRYPAKRDFVSLNWILVAKGLMITDHFKLITILSFFIDLICVNPCNPWWSN